MVLMFTTKPSNCAIMHTSEDNACKFCNDIIDNCNGSKNIDWFSKLLLNASRPRCYVQSFGSVQDAGKYWTTKCDQLPRTTLNEPKKPKTKLTINSIQLAAWSEMDRDVSRYAVMFGKKSLPGAALGAVRLSTQITRILNFLSIPVITAAWDMLATPFGFSLSVMRSMIFIRR